jgi:acetoacetyl-CoA synthetase
MPESEVLWRPDPSRIPTTNVDRFRRAVEGSTGRSLPGYDDLYLWSIEQPEEFWGELWKFLDIVASQDWTASITAASRMRETKFYAGARLNFAENLLRHEDKDVAVSYYDETGHRFAWSTRELRQQVAATAAGLREAGVRSGDRVAGFVPNHPFALVAMLAASSIGAIWSSCSPDFGNNGIIDRFGQIAPKVLFTADGYRYNGKTFDSVSRVAGFVPQLPSIERVVVFPNLRDDVQLNGEPKFIALSDFQIPSDSLEFAQLPFDHPAFVLFTSGTTGVPKCIVHHAGGALIQLMKDHQLHCDLGPEDTLFFFSTCGWMMWNWLVTGLASGCTVVLYDGSPLPSQAPDILWRIAQDEGVTAFGAGARYYAGVEKQGIEPARKFDLSRLRLLMSTGSVLSPESYDFIYDKVIGPDVLLASVTGGTDILSAFALGVPLLPLYRGEIQCRALGMAVEVYDEQGQPVVGERGELVCERPFASMPLKFWNDPDNTRYDDAYFNKFDRVWCHGDFAEITERGGLIIHGRSDAVLNPGGVRIGTAEIYRQVEQIEGILDAVCVGQDWDDDVRVVLFVVLAPDRALTDELKTEVRQAIRKNASPRHVPAKVLAVPDIPRTRSGKIAEIAVRDTINGKQVGNTSALQNPQALDHFRNRTELATA